MTPEERFQKIENALDTLSEHQAKFEAQFAIYRKNQAEEMAELREMHNKLGLAVATTNKQVGTMAEKIDALTESIDQLLKGIRPNGKP